jgi:hypothetical protein
MYLLRRLICFALLFVPQALLTEDLLLANVLERGIDVTQCLVSEKYDGVRVLLNGKQIKNSSR